MRCSLRIVIALHGLGVCSVVSKSDGLYVVKCIKLKTSSFVS